MRWLILQIGLLMLLGGCTSARKRADTEIVRRVKFHGNSSLPLGDVTDHALRQQMAQRASPPLVLTWPFTYMAEPSLYRPHLVETDRERVLTWLAHHGWFDATLRFDTERKRSDRRRKAGVIDLIGEVERGPTTRWSQRPAFTWVGSPALDVRDRALFASTMIRKGRRFRLSDVDNTQASLLRLLQDRGYAHATVTVDLEARPDEGGASVRISLDQGPRAHLGGIEVVADEALDEDAVRLIADLRPGDPFSISEIGRARQALQGTGAFDRVDVTYADEGEQVPVRLHLTQGPARQIQLGARVYFEGANFKPEILAEWSHSNTRGTLGQWNVGVSTGFGITTDRAVPLVNAWVRRSIPSTFHPAVSVVYEFKEDSSIYQLHLPRTDASAQMAWTAQLTRNLSVSMVPGFRWTRLGLPSSEAGELAVVAALGPGFANQYGLLEIGTEAHLDLVRYHDRLRTGVDARASFDMLSPVVLDNLSFSRLGLDLRAYFAPRRPFLGKRSQFLLRADIAHLISGGSELPYPERLLLGGASRFRAFRSGQVGAYDCVCVPRAGAVSTAGEYGVRRIYLSHGGSTRALLSAEAQLHRVFLDEVSLVAFAEAGTLAWSPGEAMGQDSLRVGAGGGIRYDTAIGPFRIDVSVRPLYPEDEGPSFGGDAPGRGAYIGCDDVGPNRRAFDVLSEFNRKGPLDRTLPAINFFISIGEAI